jgi:Rrf2 family protein
MFVSQKCQYALRGVFELAKHHGEGPVRTADIADAQAIPLRFLEVILAELRQGGFVESQRGSRGGYRLARLAEDLTVGEIIRYIEGPVGPVVCALDVEQSDCPLHGSCVFLPMWERVRKAVSGVYDTTTFADLILEEEKMRQVEYVPQYCI